MTSVAATRLTLLAPSCLYALVCGVCPCQNGDNFKEPSVKDRKRQVSSKTRSMKGVSQFLRDRSAEFMAPSVPAVYCLLASAKV